MVREYAVPDVGTGSVQRCPAARKVCYPTHAAAAACAAALLAVQVKRQVVYRCPDDDHFHLSTDRSQPSPTDPTRDQLAALAQALLVVRNSITRKHLFTMLEWDQTDHQRRRFRRMLNALEQARLINCQATLIAVRDHRRSVLKQVASTGQIP